MRTTKEIKALFQLLDDPDNEIFKSVSDKLVHYGKDIIPNLENYWEKSIDNKIQERIEDIIHKLNFNDTLSEMKIWYAAKKPNLLNGAFILAQYRFPQIDEDASRKIIKSIYQSCWLELHNYLTPLEQIQIINSVFYNMYKFTGNELELNKPNHFFINEVLDTRQGNIYSLSIIYQTLCEMLDIPVFAINLPNQQKMAYYDQQYHYPDYDNLQPHKISFYIDANNGTIFTQNDIDIYLKKYNFKQNENTFRPLSNQEIILNMVEQLIIIYDELNEIDKSRELNKILLFRNF